MVEVENDLELLQEAVGAAVSAEHEAAETAKQASEREDGLRVVLRNLQFRLGTTGRELRDMRGGIRSKILERYRESDGPLPPKIFARYSEIEAEDRFLTRSLEWVGWELRESELLRQSANGQHQIAQAGTAEAKADFLEARARQRLAPAMADAGLLAITFDDSLWQKLRNDGAALGTAGRRAVIDAEQRLTALREQRRAGGGY